MSSTSNGTTSIVASAPDGAIIVAAEGIVEHVPKSGHVEILFCSLLSRIQVSKVQYEIMIGAKSFNASTITNQAIQIQYARATVK